MPFHYIQCTVFVFCFLCLSEDPIGIGSDVFVEPGIDHVYHGLMNLSTPVATVVDFPANVTFGCRTVDVSVDSGENKLI